MGISIEGPEEDAAVRIARVARDHVGRNLAALVLSQAWSEFLVSVRGRLRFRRGDNADAVRAYRAMTARQLQGVNARQRWSDWRTIPRNLSGRLPGRPCRAVDLCSGTGDSTEVLAYYLPVGSEVLGLEICPRFARAARGRRYLDSRGSPVEVAFRVQSVLQTFRDPAGAPLADASVDVVNCSGALAVNFNEAETAVVAAECARVLREGGLVMVDRPAGGPRRELLRRVFGAPLFESLGSVRSCLLDRYWQSCFRRTGVSAR